MMKLDKPLAPGELRELDRFLAHAGSAALPNASALDGFFAALICSPDLVTPNEYLPLILEGDGEGSRPGYDDSESAMRFCCLAMRHYNTLVDRITEFDEDELAGANGGGGIYYPRTMKGAGGELIAEHWAKGFISGTRFRRKQWRRLFDVKGGDSRIVPILLLAYENDPDPAKRRCDPMSNEARQALIALAGHAVACLYSDVSSRREEYRFAGIGTTPYNIQRGLDYDSCPCGSGEDYGDCCGSATALH